MLLSAAEDICYFLPRTLAESEAGCLRREKITYSEAANFNLDKFFKHRLNLAIKNSQRSFVDFP